MASKELVGKIPNSAITREAEVDVNGEPKIRLGDVGNDSEELARLFTQRSSLLHLSGVTPYRISEAERLRIDKQYPGLPIMAATPEDVRKYYEKNAGLTLIVAEDPNERGKLLGSVTVQTGNVGVLAANVARVVVDEESRRKGIGRLLLKTANAYIFGEFSFFQQVTASIILGVPGDQIPQRIFRGERYKSQNEIANRCVSWDPGKGLFVAHNVLPMVLERQDFMGYGSRRGKREMSQYKMVKSN